VRGAEVRELVRRTDPREWLRDGRVQGVATVLALAVLAVIVLAVTASSTPAHPRAARAGAAATRAHARTAPAGPAFPLKMSANRRYLVDQRGRPFLIVGDSPHSLIVNLSVADADGFLAERERQGFNAAWIELLDDSYTGGRANGATYDGIVPFRTPGDLSTPNPAYFDRAAQILTAAARDHIAVFLDPIETGGWLNVLRANGRAADYRYGRYVATRFRRFTNIVWLSGNDFANATDPTDDEAALAVARGIRSVSPQAPQTVELSPPNLVGSLSDPRWRPLISLDAAYPFEFETTYAAVLGEYERRDHLPVFMVEASYDGEYQYTGPETLRREEYWTLLSGATGQLYGNHWIWPFAQGWQQHVVTAGTRQLALATRLFAGRPWYRLVPDIRHGLVVGGYGAFDPTANTNASTYVTAARTPDGRLAIAYVPSGAPIIVDMSRMAGPTRAQWYDPTDGRYRPSADRLRNAGRRQFVPPGQNAGHGTDWVLVLTAG